MQSVERVCNADKTEYYIKNKDGKNLELYTYTLAHKTAQPSSRERIYPVVETKITKLQFAPEFPYGANSIFMDLVGKLYTWIPEKSDEFLGLWRVSINANGTIYGISALPGGYLSYDEALTQLEEHYFVTAEAGEGGTISPEGSTQVPAGESIKFSIQAFDGSKIKDVMVDGKSVGKAEEYELKNVVANHTIIATFEKSGVAPKTSDNTNIALYIALLIGASGAVVITSLRVKRQSR